MSSQYQTNNHCTDEPKGQSHDPANLSHSIVLESAAPHIYIIYTRRIQIRALYANITDDPEGWRGPSAERRD